VRGGVLPWAVAVAGALGAWLIAGTGFANYDTAYALVWGRDLAEGRLPDYDVPLAPTPHPLALVVGLVLSPLGAAAETAWVVLAFLALGALGGVVAALGARAFGPAAGVLAAAIVLTREPVLSFGARAYVDVPYAALVLGALAIAVARPRAGAPVLVPLALAGLLRPEAWLFAGAYLGFLWWTGPRPRWTLVALAAAAPVAWALSDLLVTGEPWHSLSGTREGAETLRRATGLGAVPELLPRRLGEILREPVLAGAAVGGVLSLALLPRRARPLAAAGVAGVLAFLVLAVAGLPLLGRYLLLPAAILAVFCAAGALGWRRLAAGHPWRRRWQSAAALVGVGLLAFVPAQVERLERLRASLGGQRAIHDDLRALTGAMASACSPLAVPSHRAVPLLALWLDRAPRSVLAAPARPLDRGLHLRPGSVRVARAFALDPSLPVGAPGTTKPGFRERARNASWVLAERCPGERAHLALGKPSAPG